MNPYSQKEKRTDFFDVKDTILKSPVTKIILVGIGVLAVIGVSGYVFKLVDFSVRNYNQLKNTITKNS